ncbi:hypothetical protein A3844_14300 [Paenibacillus helianthi]|uniref:Uncharacterized protein n=1 Tax=Paenibacillus helianthi TaxID=1349432 RepID=A0ABX3EMI3_9BACL|nr:MULTISPECIES: hypothetical protein [Paenibacillus]OKP67922.1 hypothetical protein A3842_27645 [Paenibacillus sp. P3E]OKP86235.1 hypothetical protein A3844_14300 [Paenibacillus helianthi]OKP90704.1 hypothetical protein A3848_10565 [Paenibacillus sp. P32E]
MKKFASIAVAMGLVASFAATASADEVSGTTTTVTGNTYGGKFETVITQADIKPATPMIILTKATPFHLSMDSMTPAGWLSAQTIDTTGAVKTDSWGNEWREIYTWLGTAWIKVPASAYVITPAM